MDNKLSELKNLLIKGQQLSMQGSYQRRLPDKKAIPFLLDARKNLRQYVVQNPSEPQGWRLLSQAEECLLNYSEAITTFQKYQELVPSRDKKDLKRLIVLKENATEWSSLILLPEQLQELGKYLEQKLETEDCDHTLRITQEWLKNNIPKNTSKIISAIRNRGGFCDCEVLSNVVNE